jgi:hypothetical protein
MSSNRWPPSSQVRRALLAAVPTGPIGLRAHTLSSLVRGCDPGELVALAISQGTADVVSRQLAPYLPEEYLARLVAQARLDAARHLGYLDVLGRLASALEHAGVLWVVLKGPALAELIYGDVSRGYSDIDIMVPPRQLHRAVDALQGAGLTFAQRNWPLMVRVARAQVTLAFEGTPLVDLHWDLVYKRSTRQRFKLPSEEILERRRKVQLGTVGAWVLEPTDFAAHVVLHAALSGAHRLHWLVDIERTLSVAPPDWDLFVRRCHDWGVGLPVGVALERARRTLAASVPVGVVDRLAGGWANRALVSQLSTWVPGGRLLGGRSVRAALTRSLRDNLPATAMEFAGELREALGKVIAPEFVSRNDPRRLVNDVGGEQWFERYTELACRADRYGHVSKRDIRDLRLAG